MEVVRFLRDFNTIKKESVRMKKLLTVTLVMVFVLGLMSGVAMAASETGMEKSPNFEKGEWDSYVNQNNEDVRFDTETHRRAVPGNGGENADENSVVHEHHDASLVDPHRTWE